MLPTSSVITRNTDYLFALDYCPVISSVKAVADLFAKHCWNPKNLDALSSCARDYHQHLIEKDNVRYLAGIPFVGMLVVHVVDHYRYSTQLHSELELLLAAERGSQEAIHKFMEGTPYQKNKAIGCMFSSNSAQERLEASWQPSTLLAVLRNDLSSDQHKVLGWFLRNASCLSPKGLKALYYQSSIPVELRAKILDIFIEDALNGTLEAKHSLFEIYPREDAESRSEIIKTLQHHAERGNPLACDMLFDPDYSIFTQFSDPSARESIFQWVLTRSGESSFSLDDFSSDYRQGAHVLKNLFHKSRQTQSTSQQQDELKFRSESSSQSSTSTSSSTLPRTSQPYSYASSSARQSPSQSSASTTSSTPPRSSQPYSFIPSSHIPRPSQSSASTSSSTPPRSSQPYSYTSSSARPSPSRSEKPSSAHTESRKKTESNARTSHTAEDRDFEGFKNFTFQSARPSFTFGSSFQRAQPTFASGGDNFKEFEEFAEHIFKDFFFPRGFSQWDEARFNPRSSFQARPGFASGSSFRWDDTRFRQRPSFASGGDNFHGFEEFFGGVFRDFSFPQGFSFQWDDASFKTGSSFQSGRPNFASGSSFQREESGFRPGASSHRNTYTPPPTQAPRELTADEIHSKLQGKECLGVRFDMTKDGLNKAYRKWALVNHPDKHQTESPEKLKEIGERFQRVTGLVENLKTIKGWPK